MRVGAADGHLGLGLGLGLGWAPPRVTPTMKEPTMTQVPMAGAWSKPMRAPPAVSLGRLSMSTR